MKPTLNGLACAQAPVLATNGRARRRAVAARPRNVARLFFMDLSPVAGCVGRGMGWLPGDGDLDRGFARLRRKARPEVRMPTTPSSRAAPADEARPRGLLQRLVAF